MIFAEFLARISSRGLETDLGPIIRSDREIFEEFSRSGVGWGG